MILEEMEWDSETGLAYLTYTSSDGAVVYVTKPQPTSTRHKGWDSRNQTEKVLSLTERDWLRYERGIMGYRDPLEVDDGY